MPARFRLRDLLRWEGTIGRGPYALIGLSLLALKYNIDRFIASAVYHRPWRPFSYLSAGVDLNALVSGSDDAAFLGTLLVVAIPFIWIGTVLTIRRLRSLGLPAGLVLLFFVPVINLLLFLWLSLAPPLEREEVSGLTRRVALQVFLDRVIPASQLGSAAMSLLLTVPPAIAVCAVGASVLSAYGAGIFVGLPFAVGLLSAIVYGYHFRRTLAASLGVSLIAVGLLAALLLALFIEGLVCILMAAPIGIVMALLGGAAGWWMAGTRPVRRTASHATLAVLVALPSQMGLEVLFPDIPPRIEVRTTIDVDAPPARVWEHVVSFPPIPDPEGWLFRAGIAFPVRAKIEGVGAGAVRRCVFSTGTFVEPIKVWDPPSVLRFDVTDQPEPLEEWNPFRDIHPPHLSGTFMSEEGEFRLTALAGGRTRLEGTTWYRNRMWPAAYWRFWSDAIVHRIHLRVLEHVKRLAESDPD